MSIGVALEYTNHGRGNWTFVDEPYQRKKNENAGTFSETFPTPQLNTDHETLRGTSGISL